MTTGTMTSTRYERGVPRRFGYGESNGTNQSVSGGPSGGSLCMTPFAWPPQNPTVNIGKVGGGRQYGEGASFNERPLY